MSDRIQRSRAGAPAPTDLPVLPDGPGLSAGGGSPSWAPQTVAPVTAPASPFVGQTGFADAVTELQQRVAARLSADGARYAGLDSLGKRLRSEGLVVEELESWVSHRAQIGLSVLTDTDEDALVASVLAALGGYGPLEPLLAREDVEDIYFNGTAPTVLRLAGGRKVLGPALAATDTQLQQMLQMLAGSGLDDSAGREFSTSRPLLQLRLKSVGLLGARMSAAMDVTPHPSGTIRIHRHMEISLAQVHEQLGMIDEPLQQLLTATVLTGGKILVCGPTGAGKTVLLRALCRAIPLDKMIVTVEDDRELGVHVVPFRDEHGQVVYEPDGSLRLLRPAALVRSYEARPANAEGRGEVTMGDLNRQALRDSPDVLVVGETRGADVVWFLDAASNGVANVMGTIHAESARVVFDRIVQLVRRADPPLPADFALMAATSLDLIVHVTRDRDHNRFVSEVVEVHSGKFDETGRYPSVQTLFKPGPDGRAVPTGHKPEAGFAQRLTDAGFDLNWLNPGTSTWRELPHRTGPDSGWAEGWHDAGDHSAHGGGQARQDFGDGLNGDSNSNGSGWVR